MMIVSSSLIADNAQIDGRRRLDASFVDDRGRQFTVTALAAADLDAAVWLARQSEILQAQITAQDNMVPQEVSPLQARRALNAAGLRLAVESTIAAADQDTRDAWEFASVVRRDDPVIATMGAELALTADQIDDLFRTAGTF